MRVLRLPPTSSLFLVLAAAAALVALALGSGAMNPPSAGAEAVLEIEGACEPESVRPNEPVLVVCTVSLTNTGDEPATALSGTVFIADGCAIPSTFTFIDRTLDGVLMEPLGLFFTVPDIAPGETAEQSSRVATQNFSTGPTGGSVTITSADKPGLIASVDLCWNVANDAPYPGDQLSITRTLVGGNGVDPDEPPVPIAGAPPSPSEATFEITLTNVSDATFSDVSLLEATTGDAIVASVEPPATAVDSLDRPTWDAGDLAPGEAFTARVTYGLAPDADCGFAAGVSIATATGAARTQDYVALSDSSASLGFCSPFPDDYCLHFAPGQEYAAPAPCDDTVCWSEAPDGAMQPVSGCEDDGSCWFTPPGDGAPVLQDCDADVCWFAFGSIIVDVGSSGLPGDYFYEVPCDIEYCNFVAPDGTIFQGECDFPICWGQEPVTGTWEPIYGCGEFDGGDQCWFTAPDESWSVQSSCDEDVCWIQFDFDASFYQPVPCDEYQFCDFNAPDGSTTITGDCENPVCWAQAPGGADWQPAYDCGQFQDWCWYAPPGMDSFATLEPCGEMAQFAVNVPEGGIVVTPWQTRLYDIGEDWCWPVPPDPGSFYAIVVPCSVIQDIYWYQQDDGAWFFLYGLPESCPGVVLPEAPGGGPAGWPFPPVEGPPCEDGEPVQGVLGDSVPAETVTVEGTPADLVEGEAKPVDAELSSQVTPVEIVPGEVETLEPIHSADVSPAELVSSVRVEPIDGADFPGDLIIVPVGPQAPGSDEDGGPDVTPPDDVDDNDDTDNNTDVDENIDTDVNSVPRENADVSTLPNAGTGPASGSVPLWPIIAFVAAGFLAGALRLRPAG